MKNIKKQVAGLLLIIGLPLLLDAQISGSDTSPAKRLPSRSAKSVNRSSVQIEWLEPTAGEVVQVSDEKTQVKVVIKAGEALKKEYIRFLVNDKTGTKADEVRLYSTDDDHSLNFSTEVSLNRLDRDINELKLVVQLPSGKEVQSDPLKVSRNGNTIQVIPEVEGQGSPTGYEVFWVDPDPIMLGDKAMISKEPEIQVRFQIKAPEILLRDHLSMAVNKVLYPLSPDATLRGNNGRYTLKESVTLSEKVLENDIQLHIRVPGGTTMLSAPLRVNFTSDRPNLYVLSIGTKTNLNYTVKDATDFADLYQKQGGLSGNRLFRTVQTDLLTGSTATAGEIQGTIEELLVKMETNLIQPSDLLVLFISSHGFIDDRSGEFRIQGDDYDADRSRSTSISYEHDILSVLEELPCKKLIFIDACHSGKGAKASQQDIQKEIDKLNSKKEGLTVIVSSKEEEESYEDISWRNGAFTEAIIQGMSEGAADKNANGLITIKELFDYLEEAVPQMVGRVKDRPQHPRMLNNELGNLSIYVTNRP